MPLERRGGRFNGSARSRPAFEEFSTPAARDGSAWGDRLWTAPVRRCRCRCLQSDEVLPSGRGPWVTFETMPMPTAVLPSLTFCTVERHLKAHPAAAGIGSLRRRRTSRMSAPSSRSANGRTRCTQKSVHSIKNCTCRELRNGHASKEWNDIQSIRSAGNRNVPVERLE